VTSQPGYTQFMVRLPLAAQLVSVGGGSSNQRR
jgi:hypothetical protein